MLSYILLSALASAVLCQDTTTVTTSITESGDPVSVTVNVTEAVAGFKEGLAISGVTFNGDVTTAATRLVRHDGCTWNQRSQIYAGWQDSWKLMNAVAKDINYNEAGALDFLGAPGLNKPQQSRMSDLFANAATIQPGYVTTPFDWRLHVRCDDPQGKCQCSPVGSSNTIAYTTNRDAQSGLARINFCPLYFNQKSLLEVFVDGHSTNDPKVKYDLRTYEGTKGRTWFHELMHIDWVTKARRYGSNQHVTDVTLVFNRDNGGQLSTKAYGSIFAKSLARYPVQTGEWVLRNADNLALFALSKVIQNEFEAYPHYPVVVRQPDGPPSTFLFNFHDDGMVTLNQTDPLAAEIVSLGTCGPDEDGADVSVVVDRFASNSEYPNAALSAAAAIGQTTPAPSNAALSAAAAMGQTTPTPSHAALSAAAGIHNRLRRSFRA